YRSATSALTAGTPDRSRGVAADMAAISHDRGFFADCRSEATSFDSLMEAHTMKYMLLIHDDEKAWAKLSEAERGKIYAEYGQFGQSVRASGNYLAGAQLQPTTMATSVRVRDGKRLVTDGPFAETREQLGGYYLVEAKDL